MIAHLRPLAMAAAVVLSLSAAAAARAHGGHEGQRVVLERVSPSVDGVDVRSVPGTFGKLALSTTGTTSARVLGNSGQPVLRIGPRGVEANAAAPEWYEFNEPLGIAQVPASARRTAPARWVSVSVRRTWEWFDHRLHPAGSDAPSSWSVPLVVGTTRVDVRGRVEPARGAIALRIRGGRLAEGLTVTAIDKPVAALRLRNDRAKPVSVLGPDGEVFARIGSRGAEVNVHSSVWMATAQYRGRDLLTSTIDPAAKPEFILLDAGPELIWPDPRLLPAAATRAFEAGTLGNLATWSVPLLVDGRPGRRHAIAGTTLLVAAAEPGAAGRVPPTATSGDEGGAGSGRDGLWIAIAIAIAAAVFAAGAFVLRVRHARR